MKLSKLNLMLAAGGLMSMALVGCGGGSDAAAPTEAPVNVPVTVVDGAIQNAVVCLDRNANGACDAGEPFGKTNADGNVTLEVPAADAGKYPIVAIVGTDAIDKDNGPVTVPYTMKAPADAPALVSPLTTLVQAHVETTNTTTAEAKLSVADQLGVSGDALMADFTKADDAASLQAGTLARLVVVTKQEQVTATSGATGAGGSALSAAEIEAAVNARLLQRSPRRSAKVAASTSSAKRRRGTPRESRSRCSARASSRGTSARRATSTSAWFAPTAPRCATARRSAPAPTASRPRATPACCASPTCRRSAATATASLSNAPARSTTVRATS